MNGSKKRDTGHQQLKKGTEESPCSMVMSVYGSFNELASI